MLALFVLMRYSMFGDIARYALTGMFWEGTHGVVTSPRPTSAPTVQFNTPDGESHIFTEDYILLCGRSLFGALLICVALVFLLLVSRRRSISFQLGDIRDDRHGR